MQPSTCGPSRKFGEDFLTPPPVRRGSPDPAVVPTEGLPKSDLVRWRPAVVAVARSGRKSPRPATTLAQFCCSR